GVLRDAIEIVDGSVDRVDNPGEPARRDRSVALFAEEAVMGASERQLGPNESLYLAVGEGDDVDRGRLAVGDGYPPPASSAGDLPRSHRDVDGKSEKSVRVS